MKKTKKIIFALAGTAAATYGLAFTYGFVYSWTHTDRNGNWRSVSAKDHPWLINKALGFK